MAECLAFTAGYCYRYRPIILLVSFRLAGSLFAKQIIACLRATDLLLYFFIFESSNKIQLKLIY